MKNQIMNVQFMEDDQVLIRYGEKNQSNNKQAFLQSFQKDIMERGFVVANDIHRQDIGEVIYYQFYYFDGTTSRNIWFQIPKTDLSSIKVMDQIIAGFESQKPEIIFDEKPITY